ncbi:MAG: type II toxin-antitoxin system RelE/ParE family toxin [bacterium]
MRVVWSARAQRRLEEIEAHIAIDDVRAAMRLVMLLVAQGQELATFPRRGRVGPEVDQPELREPIVRGYRILYEVGEDTVDILTVFEGHRLLRDDELDR